MSVEAGEVYTLAGKRVWVAGHRGMVGAAILRRLTGEDCEVLTITREDVDLRRQAETEEWIATHKPHVVFLAAAKVGGIHANEAQPAEFLYDNLAIEANVIHGAWKAQVEKLLAVGSSCIYPRLAPQPMPEEALLSGPLEPTNEWYSVAKIAGIKLCQAYRKQYGADFISAQPTNLYGPGDNFDLTSSHVIPALIAKAHQAKVQRANVLEVWGTGTPRREFLYVDDLADALVFLMKRHTGALPINIGTGEEVTIRELAETIVDVVDFEGDLKFDTTMPDGPPRKLLDSRRLHKMGWRSHTQLRHGLHRTYGWYARYAD